MPEFPHPAPVTVLAELPAGSIEVIAEERDSAAVVVEPYDDHDESRLLAERTRVELVGDVLRVVTPDSSRRLFRRSGAVRAEVRVPLDSSLRAKTGSAGTNCLGRFRQLTLVSASGDVSAGHVTGPASIKLSSGDLRLERADGALVVRSASGNVTAGSVGGPVQVKLASGNVDIGEAASDVHVATASGDVRVGASRQGTVRVGTASGQVSVGVRAGTAVWLDLNTVSGDTRNGLTMTDEAPESGPQLTLAVRTVSGDIAVHRVG